MIKTYKHITIITMFLCVFNFIHAQPNAAKKDKIDAARVAFITKQLNLTVQEAEVFWPLYNEMNDKEEAARKEFRRKYNAKTNFDSFTDADAETYLNAELLLRQKEFEIYKEYYEKFRKILPVKKVAALKKAEEDFKRELVKIIKTQ